MPCTMHVLSVFVAVLLALVLRTPVVSAISSRDCKALVGQAVQRFNGKGQCHSKFCGWLDETPPSVSFMDKLSPACKAVMERYRAPPTELLQHGFPQPPLVRSIRAYCSSQKTASRPTNAVVVETPVTSKFIMCTVPKVACSSFRKLLNTLIRWPTPAETKTWDQIMKAHFDYYPTVWHYKHRHHNITQTHPTFILGRNPYVRVLSGFLNKMVIDKSLNEAHDMWNMKDTNKALGIVPDDTSWQPTIESYTQFVKKLYQAGTVEINDHFQQARLVCDGGQFNYEYWLRLEVRGAYFSQKGEDMSEWFPCWEAGLGLGNFTRAGWETTPEGKRYTGVNDECWWKPPAATCEDYYAKATDASGHAQPVPEEDAAAVAERHDEHDTKASEKWKAFYTQETGDLIYELFKPDFLAFGYERAVFDK